MIELGFVALASAAAGGAIVRFVPMVRQWLDLTHLDDGIMLVEEMQMTALDVTEKIEERLAKIEKRLDIALS